jgi:hypothetical protein
VRSTAFGEEQGNLSPQEAPAVAWIHGTNIGIAESA